ncbi:hypothetical protein [Microvirga massiliensis]|uniref:hypothetical protein n=1 Tax=Microvirga massiliensis TaxID=1033741 RepID=UPI00062B7340|nr:hypothetical protein [Microvirga massiliensis]
MNPPASADQTSPTRNPSWDLANAVAAAAVERKNGLATTTLSCIGAGYIGPRAGHEDGANIWQVLASDSDQTVVLYTQNAEHRPVFRISRRNAITVTGFDLGIDDLGRRSFLVETVAA